MGERRQARPAARLMVLSGPSGVGRHHVTALVRARSPAWRPVPVTTRPRGDGEVDGVDYRFVERAEFDALRGRGDLLEWVELAGHGYGTPGGPVRARLGRGEPVLLSLDLPGARQVRRAVPAADAVLLVRPEAVAPGREAAREVGLELDAVVVVDSVVRAAGELLRLLGSAVPP